MHLRGQNGLTEEERILRRALTIEDKILPANDFNRGSTSGNGLAGRLRRRPEEGKILLLRALSFFSRAPEPVFSLHAVHLNNLARVYFLEGARRKAWSNIEKRWT